MNTTAFFAVFTNLELLKIISAFACPLNEYGILTRGLIHVLKFRPRIHAPSSAIDLANSLGHFDLAKWIRNNYTCTLCKKRIVTGVCAICGIGPGNIIFIYEKYVKRRSDDELDLGFELFDEIRIIKIALRSPDYNVTKYHGRNDRNTRKYLREISNLKVNTIVIEDKCSLSTKWIHNIFPNSEIRLYSEDNEWPIFHMLSRKFI